MRKQRKEKKELIVFPISGLCNRLSVIESAIIFAEKYDYQLVILWDQVTVPCKLQELFSLKCKCDVKIVDIKGKYRDFIPHKSIKDILGKILHALHIRKYKARAKCRLAFLKEQVCLTEKNILQYDSIFVQACVSIYPFDKIEHIVFNEHDVCVSKSIMERAQDKKEKIGVHIRRGDHVGAIQNSPTELFEQKMESYISERECVFYLATDDSDVANNMLKRFPRNVLLQKGKTYERFSTTGQHEAVVDLCGLALTDKIWGSSLSSYSVTAAKYGGIPLEIVEVEKGNADDRED